MVYIKLKCRVCGKCYDVTLDDIDSDMLFSCTECKNVLRMDEAERIKNVSLVENFEVLEICTHADDMRKFRSSIFETDMSEIMNLYREGDKETQDAIAGIIDAVYLILSRKKSDDTDSLKNAILEEQKKNWNFVEI